tara:strand:+ start:70 stop:309 length:240 start_codon:yes stop_codon:yes gene_type:complete
MKIFLIVIAMVTGQGATQTDLYVIEDPDFKQSQQCIQFVQSNTIKLVQKAKSVYPDRDVENIYCVSKERLKVLISSTQA